MITDGGAVDIGYAQGDPGELSAGEVIIAGTAVYFAQEWVRGHWQDIKNWTDDAGHFVGSTAAGAFPDGEKLLSWLNPL
jgi:hypothetical protein